MQLALDGDSEPVVEPLLSAQLHRGWVSDVQLVPHGGDTGLGSEETWSGNTPGEGHVPLLLTAGNDGALAVWDLAQVHPAALHCRLKSDVLLEIHSAFTQLSHDIPTRHCT